MSNQKLSYQTADTQSELAVKKIADQIIASGKISSKDHNLLTSTVLINGEISDENRRQINRIFDHIQTGQLKLVDW